MYLNISKVTAIDPPGCGCMECITGEYIPYDSPYIDEVLEAVLNGDISPRNNLNDGTLVIYRTSNGIHSTVDSTMVSGSDIVILTPNNEYRDEDNENSEIIDVTTLVDEDEDDESLAEKRKEMIESIVNGDAVVANPTYSTYLAYRSRFGETGIIELTNVQTEADIAILLYDW